MDFMAVILELWLKHYSDFYRQKNMRMNLNGIEFM